jgi:hypothetical protein
MKELKTELTGDDVKLLELYKPKKNGTLYFFLMSASFVVAAFAACAAVIFTIVNPIPPVFNKDALVFLGASLGPIILTFLYVVFCGSIVTYFNHNIRGYDAALYYEENGTLRAKIVRDRNLSIPNGHVLVVPLGGLFRKPAIYFDREKNGNLSVAISKHAYDYRGLPNVVVVKDSYDRSAVEIRTRYVLKFVSVHGTTSIVSFMDSLDEANRRLEISSDHLESRRKECATLRQELCEVERDLRHYQSGILSALGAMHATSGQLLATKRFIKSTEGAAIRENLDKEIERIEARWGNPGRNGSIM